MKRTAGTIGVAVFQLREYTDELHNIFGALQFIPLPVTERNGDLHLFTGLSPFFDDTEEGTEPPKYNIIYNKYIGGKYKLEVRPTNGTPNIFIVIEDDNAFL